MKNTSLSSISRREFLIDSAAALGGLAAAPGLPGEPAQARNHKVLHIIGYSHIDAAWLWPWRDGADEVLSTFRSALDRLNETPDFCYSQTSSAYYKWVQNAAPDMFKEILERIRQGRWEVVGAWPVEPDCNIPSTESFVRHSLYGKRYCQQELGANVTVGINPDSFGHAAGLPTILAHAGFDSYVFGRPDKQEMALPPLFWWEGQDGSCVLAMRIWKTYSGTSDLIPAAAKEAFVPGFDDAAFFLGVGDHGGAVTREEIRKVIELRKDPNLPDLRFSTLRDFFHAVRISPALQSLPVIRGGLQHHSRGCYSAFGYGKFLNRRTERLLTEAEAIATIGAHATGSVYPTTQFAESWWKLCFNQFHDVLAGTALYSDYEDVRDGLGYACEGAQAVKVEGLERLAIQVDMRGVKETALFLFNPLPWRRTALVEHCTSRQMAAAPAVTHLTSADGASTPVQWERSDSMTPFYPRLTALVELPPCGYRTLELDRLASPAAAQFSERFSVDHSHLGISSLKAEDGTQLLAHPTGLVVISDTSDTWGHGIAQFRQEVGRPTLISSAVIEDGPVLRVTRQHAQWQNSRIYLDIREFVEMNFVELRFVIDWNEHEQILKLEIPTALSLAQVYAKVPGAIAQPEINGGEEPYHDWAAVQGKIGNRDYSVALINNSTYSYDCLDGLFRTTVVRSAPFARHQPGTVTYNDAAAWQDQGRQERTFWLMGAAGGYTSLALDRRADELQSPAEYVMCSAHKGEKPREQSFLEIMPSNVWVVALKQAEEGGGTIIRLQERAGRATEASLKSEILGLSHNVNLSPWELKTLLIMRNSATGLAQLHVVSSLEV